MSQLAANGVSRGGRRWKSRRPANVEATEEIQAKKDLPPHPGRRDRLPPTRITPLASQSSTIPTSTQAPAQPSIERIPSPIPGPSSLSHLSSTRFLDFYDKGQMSKQMLDAIPFEHCTEVQAATLGACLSGSDVLARAKTGTGKTLAFMVPAIERLSRLPRPPAAASISVLVLSPTRELAIQIEKETLPLLKGTPFGVQHVVGGTNKNAEARRLRNERADILVATPGRLIDHLDDPDLRPKLARLQCLILDEADRLLDAGFRRDLEKIFRQLPDRKASPRQTLLFSATFPKEVKEIASIALLPEHQYISTVSESEESTHTHVEQEYAIVELENVFPTVASHISTLAQNDPETKIMAFLPTARATGLIAALFRRLKFPTDIPIYEIHSRMSQPQRTAATEAFRSSTRGILFSSDVTARGIDIPNVTSVLQIGLPASGEQYVHRLGRTARAGSSGSGLLILSPFEKFFLLKKDMRELPLKERDASAQPQGNELKAWRSAVDVALDTIDEKTKSQAYQAWLGFYKGSMKDMRWNEADLVNQANGYAKTVLRYKGEIEGESQEWKPPALMARTIGMMQLRAVKHLLNVEKDVRPATTRNGARGGNIGGARGGIRKQF